MKNLPISLRFIFCFSVFGFFFSGYLSAVKLFSGSCALRETCPTFLYLPACWFGFALFAGLLTLSVRGLTRRIVFSQVITRLGVVSFVGVLFASYLTMIELPSFLRLGLKAYTLGVPSCFLGLVFFMLIFVTSALAWSHDRDLNN